MKNIRRLLRSEAVAVTGRTAASAAAGFVLSLGTVSGVASPLAAALAGASPPLYAAAILCGALGAYTMQGAPEGMQFLVACLTAIVSARILLHDLRKPHVLCVVTALCCMLAGAVLDVLLYGNGGRLPLYLLESMLIGVTAYFLADAGQCLCERRRIAMRSGRQFTFAMCYLLTITALCGLDTAFCNPGRVAGIACTLLCARQLHQHGGTLCGALTSCGVTLCSVRLGTPMLFLPVTAMLMGYVSGLPNALFIPVFFLMEAMSSAVLDSSMELVRVIVELLLGCTLYGLCSHLDLFRFVAEEPSRSEPEQSRRFLAVSLHELEEETAAVMERLTIPEPEDITDRLRQRICEGCQRAGHCWRANGEATRTAFRKLRHAAVLPEELTDCLHKKRLQAVLADCSRTNALAHMQRVHMLQNRSVTLEYLQLLERMTTGPRTEELCTAETEVLHRLLKKLSASAETAAVRRLKSGRYVAELYTRQERFPAAALRELLQERLGVALGSMELCQKQGTRRISLYELPPYTMEFCIHSVTAPGCERCGDQADGFTDGAGNSILVLSDGMGSGSTASLAARIAVRTLRRMICSAMPPETAIRLVNALLLTETNTENFATLDVCILNGDTGTLTLYKAGAAATLLCRRTKVHSITSRSFPVGIVPDAAPSVRQISSLDRDGLIMLSDGISEGEYPYIRQLLRQGTPPAQLARTICEKAAVFHGGAIRDDMTVIAARISCANTAKLTKNVNHLEAVDRQIAVHA